MTDHAAAFLEEYRTAAKASGALAAARDNAEQRRKIVFAEQALLAGSVAVVKADHMARASEQYKSAVAALHECTVAANEAAAELDYLGKRWEKWRTQMASARVKQQMEER